MIHDNDWVSYKVEINSRNEKKYGGKIKYSNSTMRRHKKSKFIRFTPKQVAIILAIVGPVTAYGARTMMQDANKETHRLASNIRQTYTESLPVAYTNMSASDINKLDFDERIELYNDYINYVESNAPAIIDSRATDYSKLKADAQALLEEYDITKDSLTSEYKAQKKQAILDKYEASIDLINSIYNGKYSLYNTGNAKRYISNRSL